MRGRSAGLLLIVAGLLAGCGSEEEPSTRPAAICASVAATGLVCQCAGGTCWQGYCYGSDGQPVDIHDPICALQPCATDCDCPPGGNCVFVADDVQGYCGSLGIPPVCDGG
jgi:hypothetical protein